MNFNHFKKRGRFILPLFLCFISILFLTANFFSQRLEQSDRIEDFYKDMRPLAEVLKPLVMGHESVVADLIWLASMTRGLDLSEKLAYFTDRAHAILTLDPRFEAFIQWFIPMAELDAEERKPKFKKVIKVIEPAWSSIKRMDAEKPFKHHFNAWNIPLSLMHVYGLTLKDYEKALPYAEELLAYVHIPSHLRAFATVLYDRMNENKAFGETLEKLMAIQSLESEMGVVKNTEMKTKILEKMKSLYKDLSSQDAMQERMEIIQNDVRGRVEQWRKEGHYTSFLRHELLKASGIHSNERAMFEYTFPILSHKPMDGMNANVNHPK